MWLCTTHREWDWWRWCIGCWWSLGKKHDTESIVCGGFVVLWNHMTLNTNDKWLVVEWQTTGLVTMVQWNLHNHCNTTPHSLLFTWMVCPQHMCLLFLSNPPFSWIVFVQATASLMTASVCLRGCATRTHWPCFLFDEWLCLVLESLLCALCFSFTAFLMTTNDGNTIPTTPFHSVPHFLFQTTQHLQSMLHHPIRLLNACLLSVWDKRITRMVSWVHSIIQQQSLHALAWGHSAIIPTSLFGDCVVGTLSVGTLTEAHTIDCE